MKKKILSSLLCATVAATTIIGCGQSAQTTTETQTEAPSEAATAEATAEAENTQAKEPGEKVTLSIYTQYADDDTKVPYDYAVEQLKEAYPNVELNLIVQAQDDGQTLKTLAATGQLPDIYQASTDIINTFRESNQIMVLNDVAKSTGFLDKLYEANKDLAYAEDGNIYAFPFSGQEYVLWYYNKALFEENGLEVPKTYDELKNCIEVFKSKGITPLALFGQEGWNTAAAYDVVATRYTEGGIKALDEGTASITDEAYLTAAKTLEELVAAGLFQDSATTTNYDQASEMFLSGNAAMFINGQWYIEDATAALGENVDWMFYPAADEASYEAGKSVFSGGGSASGFAVNPDSENAELAAEVAEFITEKYCEAKVMYRHNPLVALDTGKEPDSEYPAMMKKLSDTLPSITATTKFTWGLTNSTFNDGIQSESQGLVSGQFTADEFIADMKDVME
ncbi:raffinose/stachyose/melibiose transport system substrate-binding protein [Butyrivibrio proteoclasticus]|uniref:Raffinose/stachyose/melibiose transport system substrate-binding protein n=1 Tax=Butyrivibrio proteoclasticus TaxID=43305 RepID=A0A1I5QFJ9_9FIRM|nr:extracellular solute-binding protein [Butyrivibrio proteoclasticus]SFP44821.1 raffinose/stachyose/melibiose transport system substrate-binding protein [Butyrivibrio proteoclasticus]